MYEKFTFPEDWDPTSLSDVFDLRRETMVPTGISNQRYIGLEHIDSGRMKISRYGGESEIRSAKNKFYPDDILYGKLRPYLDKSVLADIEGICSTDILVFKVDKERILPSYGACLVHTSAFLQYAINTTTGVNHPRTSWSSIGKFRCSIPKLAEQSIIVHALFILQQAIEQQEKIIAKTKELKRSLMHRLFTYGLRGEELKETEIGLMPESWEVFSISQKCLVKGSTMALTELPLLDTKNTRLELVHGIKVSDMNTVGNEKSINHANIVAYLSKQDAIKKAVPRNSIVFPKRGAAIATNKKRLTTSWTVLDPNLIAIIPNEDIDAEYLYYWFLIFDLRSIQDPGPTPQLNKKDVNPIRFPCPSIEEQKQISSFLSIIDSRHSLSEQKKNCLNELFKSMLQLLMTGQVRVKDVDFGEINV
jgi:type I restriction enzyme S subunit